MRVKYPLTLTVLLLIIVGAFATMMIIGDPLFELLLLSETSMKITIGATASLVLIIVMQFITRSRYPIAHNVAIIGFPKSGKTTLITATFGEIFARRIRGINAELRGSSTIERVNTDLSIIESGKSLGPTTDQDLFAYRTNVYIPSFPLSRLYKVEFGDFPGNDSEEYSSEYGDWFHKTPFFKWVAEADALVFTVDIGMYLKNIGTINHYVVKVSSAIRAAWQHYLEFKVDGTRSARRTPLVLVFTKSDLLKLGSQLRPPSLISDKSLIDKLAFGETTPKIDDISQKEIESLKEQIEDDFVDLIRFMRGESKRFKIIFTSCFAFQDGNKYGLGDFFKSVLPTNPFGLGIYSE